ncbi:alpha-N-arabinofuranosidase [Pseudoduganella namucuonensis]|uniref:non-reducing end alpha-L-arabinofuranosidase n=1 Tax=Pseudoduganella namucuonensis TaxID=1035707 RepID=A0A1I7LH66_9BURK|nr:alpha-L-arabinofuranosidase C-terminal domain-containing protein [Pseudoduganella namucuonensis]SFV09035.1 alpha-N-arabinofuranosidase [Pseudoduganella namucuonensis]
MKHLQFPIMAAGLLVAASAWAAQTVDIEIDAGHPGPVISKNLYGHAAADGHAGNFGGMWVGPRSKIPNIKGWRKDVVAALKELRVPVLRWPGGCSADEYNWRDAIGPRGKATDGNAVGTHEFFDLVELLGADAYVNGNVGTGSPREAADWVEYMAAPSGSTLARLRTKNGRAKPFKVAYFGVGRAPWGCGGNMTPQYYADLYNQYAVFIRGKSNEPPKLIASGGGAEWTDELSTKKRIRDYRDGISAHRPPTATVANDSGSAAPDLGEARWIAALNRAWQINEFIDSNVAMLDKNDATKKTSLAIGEWDGGGAAARQRPQPNALGDALVAALHFHAFHAHAGRLSMANIAQQAPRQDMIQAERSTMVLTPTYHAFRMHVPFQDAVSLPVKLDNNPTYGLGGIALPTVSASAARAMDGKLYLSLVNANPKEAVAVAVSVAGVVAKAANGSVLTASAMDAHNSVASPGSVAPAPFTARGGQGKLLLTLKAKSVTVLAIDE